MSPDRILFAAVLVLTASAAPARAEENRLLPFWAQPYPTGFVQTEPGLPEAPCVVRRRIRTPHGVRLVPEDRCGPVLHARD